MLYTIPDYYKEFKCTADKCEDTCCAGWQIVVDQKSLRRYRHLKGAVGRAVRRRVDWKQGVFRQDCEKRCAFLDKNNLCNMYKALGEKSLCRTCRLYPRHIEEFEGVREISLSLSCPEVARILLNKKEPVQFKNYQKPGEEEYEDFDYLLYSQLVDVREQLVQMLQERNLSIELRAALLLAIVEDVQTDVDQNQLFSCSEVPKKYQTEEKQSTVKNQLEDFQSNYEKKFQFAKETFKQLHSLELLDANWKYCLLETENLLYKEDATAYQAQMDAFQNWKQEHMPDWDIIREQILVYFIFTYFCGAVYDEQIFAKARMTVFSAFVLEEMLRARWIKNEYTLDMEDVQEIVYRYSREIEHSDDNLKWLDDKLKL